MPLTLSASSAPSGQCAAAEFRPNRPLIFLAGLAALTAVSFGLCSPALAAPDGHQALKLLGKPVAVTGQVLSIKPRPATDGYRRAFDQRDYFDQTTVVRKQHGGDIFVDMDRQMAEDSESWSGAAGMQINW